MIKDDLTKKEKEAYMLYEKGLCPSYSMNLEGKITSGFGQLSKNGEFDLPLVVNPKNFRIIPRKELA